MRTANYWLDAPDLEVPSYPGPLPHKADVAIVGGGYTGLAAARVLAKHGAEVVVLEQETIGWGASSRNGGMLTPGIKAPTQTMFKRYGAALGRAFWQASLEALQLVETLIVEEEIDCDYDRRGYMALAYKPAHFRAMEERAKWFETELGYRQRVVPAMEIAGEIGTSVYYGGLVASEGAGLQPAKYVSGLGRAAARAGARLCERAAVRQLERVRGGYRVHTDRDVLSADAVLIATNGYTDTLVKKLKPRIFPVGSYIIVTEPLDDALQRELSPQGRVFYDSKNFLNYFRLTADGRMLFGGRNDLSTGLDLVESAARLRRRMVTVFPQLESIPVTHSWTGHLGLTFDLMPHIGNIEGITYALGYGGHGITIATYLGTEAGLLLSGQKDSSSFQEIAHPTRFFYRQRPWFVPFAAQYFRLLDWLT